MREKIPPGFLSGTTYFVLGELNQGWKGANDKGRRIWLGRGNARRGGKVLEKGKKKFLAGDLDE